ncbi:MAG: oxidative damage protection protein [Methylobacter sp.]|nr:MAG: oxidative damage protection protein [Methylobacter sp.]PPD23464.1 MAG: oxidative damage protection protein [Methylobacter sp.]
MTRMIHCVKLGKELLGLERAPYPGELGQRIYESVSKEAWQQWLQHQTMLVNEYRLSLFEAKAKQFLLAEMEKYLFGEGAVMPEGYVPPKTNQQG